jgi:hypothetical protein
VVDFSFKLELSDLFPFSAGLNFDFTDGVPLLNGVEFQMPAYALGEDGIFNVTALNEKVLITFGMEKDYFDDGMDNKTEVLGVYSSQNAADSALEAFEPNEEENDDDDFEVVTSIKKFIIEE